MGGHFKYLGSIFNFDMKDVVPRTEIEEKMDKILQTITNLNVTAQTKLKIFSIFCALADNV